MRRGPLFLNTIQPIKKLGAGFIPLDPTNPNRRKFDPASLGFAVDDVVLIYNVKVGSIGTSTIVNSANVNKNSDWNAVSYTWTTLGYITTFWWRKLTDLSAYYFNGAAGGGDYGIAYDGYSGVESAAVVVNDMSTLSDSRSITFPSKDSSCKAIAALFIDRVPDTNLNASLRWSDRLHDRMTYFAYDIMDQLNPESGDHTDTFTGRGSTFGSPAPAGYQIGLGIELRV